MLINCVAYENGRRLGDLPVQEISDYLQRPGCFIWVALHDATPEELSVMQEEFGLHPLAVEDARHGHQRPKIEEYGDSLFAVIHLLELSPTDELRQGELNVFIGPNYVLSVRNQSTRDFREVRQRCQQEPELMRQGASFVHYALMDAVVDRYFPIVDHLEAELEAIEGRIFAKNSARSNVARLYELKGKVTGVRHAVGPLLDVAAKLAGTRGPALAASSRDYFRDVYDHLLRINATLDAVRDTIGTAIQVNLSVATIEDTEVSKRLAAWAGIFGVATAFAGIWGMNFKFMPELEWQYGYPLAIGIIGTACVALFFRFKKAGWL